MSCLYLHEILPASAFTSAFHISHGLIDSLIRYSVFKVQTANLFDLLKACRRGTRKQSLLRHGHSPSAQTLSASALSVICALETCGFSFWIPSKCFSPFLPAYADKSACRLSCENACYGDEEIRTLDPLLARQVLSQLS